MKTTKPKLIVVLGPTASGKSALAIKIAKKYKGEIISADSRQIYKGLDIGSNKIKKREMAGIPHHLLDIARPDQKITLYHWQQKAFRAINKIISPRGRKKTAQRAVALPSALKPSGLNGWAKKLPILCGGTGLYICSILQNYKMPQQSRPCPYDFIIFGLKPERQKLYKKIDQRVLIMLQDGLVKEVENLYKQYPDYKLNALTGIGYQEIIKFLENKITFQEAIRKIQQNSRHYAKRQMTWFRRMERQGLKIYWNNSWAEIIKKINKFLK